MPGHHQTLVDVSGLHHLKERKIGRMAQFPLSGGLSCTTFKDTTARFSGG